MDGISRRKLQHGCMDDERIWWRYIYLSIYIYKLEIEWTWWCQNGILTVNIFRWSLVNPLLYPESWWLSIVFSVANGRKLQTHQNLIVVNISHNVFPFKLYIYIPISIIQIVGQLHPHQLSISIYVIISYIYNSIYIGLYRYLYFSSHEFLWHIPILSHSTPISPQKFHRTLSSKSAEYQDRRGTTKTSCRRGSSNGRP